MGLHHEYDNQEYLGYFLLYFFATEGHSALDLCEDRCMICPTISLSSNFVEPNDGGLILDLTRKMPQHLLLMFEDNEEFEKCEAIYDHACASEGVSLKRL